MGADGLAVQRVFWEGDPPENGESANNKPAAEKRSGNATLNCFEEVDQY
jgi:hypothetical protein